MVQSAKEQTSSRAQRPGPLRRWSRRLLKVLLISYLLVCGLLYFFQNRLVFPGSLTPLAPSRFTPPAGSSLLTLQTEDGIQINGLFCRAFDPAGQPVKRPIDCPTIIYSYGNGQVTAWTFFEVDLFRRCGANVLVADYPGYGLSLGKPSEKGCYDTAEALWRYAQKSHEIDSNRLVSVGWSLGSAVAIDLANRHPMQALMTTSAFTRIKTVAGDKFWFVPARAMLHYDFPNADKLPRITCPTLIIHGMADTLVPASMANDLLALSPAAWKRQVLVPGAGHNDVFSTGYEQIRPALTELLSQVKPRSAAPTTRSTPIPEQPIDDLDL